MVRVFVCVSVAPVDDTTDPRTIPIAAQARIAPARPAMATARRAKRDGRPSAGSGSASTCGSGAGSGAGGGSGTGSGAGVGVGGGVGSGGAGGPGGCGV